MYAWAAGSCTAYHGAALAQEEPRFAVREGLFELGNVRVVEADAWKHLLQSMGTSATLMHKYKKRALGDRNTP